MVLAKGNSSNFQIKDSYIEVQKTIYPQNIALVEKEDNKEKIIGQVKIVDQYLISNIPENEFLDEYPDLKSGFQDLSIDIEADQPIFDKENFYHSPSLLDKTGLGLKSLLGIETQTLPEYRLIKEINKSKSIQANLDLEKIKIETHYKKLEIENEESVIKQTFTLINNSDQDLSLSLLLKNRIDAETIHWNDHIYSISDNPQKFGNPAKISFYSQNMKYLSFFDYSDIPEEFLPELWVERQNSRSFLILSLNVFIPAHSSKTIDPQYQSQITPQAIKAEKIGDSTVYKLELDDDVVEIGTKEHSPSRPYLKLNRWGDETSLTISSPYISEKEAVFSENENMVKWIDKDWELHLYPLEPREFEENGHQVKQLEQGGFEFEIILNKDPRPTKTGDYNIILNIETKGLKFYYQPPLNQENQEEGITCTETTCWDKDGNVVTFRPENVVGSYAVYHKTQDKLFKTEEEAEKYKAGKAFHIYRPKITDAIGNWDWEEQTIDVENGTITITIPQDFLDNAVYPIRSTGETFGYEIGGDSTAYIGSFIRGSWFSCPESGTANSISFCLTCTATKNYACGIYKRSDYSYHANTPEESITAKTKVYVTISFGTPNPSIEAIDYYLMAQGTDTTYNPVMHYDAGTDLGLYGPWGAHTSPLEWADSISSYTTDDRKFGIYCTYEAAPSNAAPTVGTVILNNGNDITLTESVTTTVSATATISDTDGISDISTTTGKLYRSGVGSGCSADDNNCYIDSICATTTPCAATSCTAICNYDVWFHADPTDAGDYSDEWWDAWIKVIDTENASSSATSTGVEMNTLRALNVTSTANSTINYGSLNPGDDTGTLSETTTVTDTGNAAIDIYLYGVDMATGSYSIAVGQQEYSTSSGVSYASGTDLTTATITAVELDLSKPTSHPSTSTDDIYWGLAIPPVQAAGTYTGTNTFEAKAD